MSLFVKRNTESDHLPLYSTSAGDMVLVVGLGNIGKEYESTRHNLGFQCVDGFAKQFEFPAWINKTDLKCQLTKTIVGGSNVILVKPTTFMNKSGKAVGAVQHYFKIPNSKTVVVHDDLDIDFGQIRCRVGGGSAGNNGIKSLIEHLEPEFSRIRVGIKNDMLGKMDSADFVLAKFNSEEKALVPKLVKEVSSIISEYTASKQLPHETRSIL
jgi:PTH1 family peptidyl-tRNA hydrolase